MTLMQGGRPAETQDMARASASAILRTAQGRIGQQVIVMTRSGLAVKSRPKYKQFPNPETAQARNRLKAAAEAWNGMDPDAIQKWRAYALTLAKANPVNGHLYHPSAYNAFSGLATRYLQANPGGTIPLLPPEAGFPGEFVEIGAQAEAGGIRFSASGPNSPGVVSLLLVQKLPNIRRSPTTFYKEAAVHAFAPGSLDFLLPLPPGAYALAYRFIQASTGLSTGELLIGVVQLV